MKLILILVMLNRDQDHINLLFPQIPAVAPPPSWTPVYSHHATERDYGVSPPAPPPPPPYPSSSSPAPPPPPDQVPARIVNQESGASSSSTISASSSSVSSSILSEIGLSLTCLIHYKTSVTLDRSGRDTAGVHHHHLGPHPGPHHPAACLLVLPP